MVGQRAFLLSLCQLALSHALGDQQHGHPYPVPAICTRSGCLAMSVLHHAVLELDNIVSMCLCSRRFDLSGSARSTVREAKALWRGTAPPAWMSATATMATRRSSKSSSRRSAPTRCPELKIKRKSSARMDFARFQAGGAHASEATTSNVRKP